MSILRPRRSLLVALALGVALGLAASLVVAASTAPRAGAAVTRTATTVDLRGTVFHAGTQENVTVDGILQVTATTQNPSDSCHVQIKLTDTTATGNASGRSYRAFGTVNWPGDPCRAATISRVSSFRLQALPGNPVVPPNPVHEFQVRTNLNFGNEGNLIEGSNAQIVGGVT